MEVSFKKCGPKNLLELQELSISTFTQAFQAQNNADDFEAYLDSAFSLEQLRSELSNPFMYFYFVAVANTLAGYFKINVLDAQNELHEIDGMELERIYVKPGYQGMGIGLEMLSFVESLALKADKTYLWLGVWEKNLGAIRFYERHGYKKFDTHPYFIGDDKQTDWLLKKQLI